MTSTRRTAYTAVLVVLFAALWFCCGSCTHTVSHGELVTAAMPDYRNTLITITYYCGSKDGHDYFLVTPPFRGSRRYRVIESDSPIKKRFTLTRDKTGWRFYEPFSLQHTATTNVFDFILPAEPGLQYVPTYRYSGQALVLVPQPKDIFITGEVTLPGRHPWKDGLTLSKAIAGADGVTQYKKDEFVTITRGDETVTKSLTKDASVPIEVRDIIRVRDASQ